MAQFYIAQAPTGGWVKAPADGATFLLFDGEAPIDMSDYGKWANGVAISPDGMKALVRTRNDRVVRVWRNGTKTDLSAAFGNNTVGFNETGDEFFAYLNSHYMANGVPTECPKDASGQYITVNGWTQIVGMSPRWTDQVSPVTIDGITMTRPVTLNGWTLGMETAAASRILIVNQNTVLHEWFEVWTPYTNWGPGLTFVAGDPSAAISLPGVIVPRSAFVPILPPPPPPLTTTKYPRPIFFAPYFTDSVQYGTTSRFIGNMFFPDREKNRDRPLPIIAAFDTYDPSMENTTLYYYLHGGGSNPWNTAKGQADFFADKSEKPFIIYIDSRNPSNFTTLPSWVPMNRSFLALQAYPNPGESVAAFKAAMTNDQKTGLFDVAAKHKLPLVLTPCFYDRNGTMSLSDILKHMPTYDTLIDKFQVIGIMPFSDLRPGGMADYPVLYDYAQAMYDALPVRPNRYTFWTPSDHDDAKRAAKDQVGYQISGWSSEQQTRLKTLIDLYY